MKKSNDNMQVKLDKAKSLKETLSYQLKKANRKNEKLLVELACLKSRVQSLSNTKYDPRYPSMVTSFEEHNQQLANRNQIRPRQPPSIVTSTITSNDWEDGRGQPHEQTNEPPVYQLEGAPLTGQPSVFDIVDLDNQQLMDLFVFNEDDAARAD